MFNFLLETFRLGLTNLRLHKLRSLLTALGIILGVAAVIIMVAIGEGTKQAALEQVRQLGANNIRVASIRPPESSDATGRTSRVLEYGLKRLDLERIKTLPGLAAIVPLKDTEQRVVHGDLRAPAASAVGTTPQMFQIINLRPARGRLFTSLETERGEAVCVIGSKVAEQLFPFQDPLGRTIQVGSAGTPIVMLTVVGVLEPVGLRVGSEGAAIIARDPDQQVYFPITLAQSTYGDAIIRRLAGTMERKQVELSEIWLRAERIEDVERLAAVVQNILAMSRRGQLHDVDVKAPIEILRNAERLNRMFNFILVVIAGVSLVVGGIGIMNIMLATVTERTREIGVRRALGAKRRHITLQFLVETTVISLAGGLIGIGLGAAVAKLLPVVVAAAGGGEYPTNIAPWSVLGSFLVSGAIGIGFGLYP
ncbi:MAG: ABC transporter permease, partial [Phycisphaerae bacterium]|nr:ABC transporter permease [Phycisphaerae bacterium]MDW8261485.1 ABC transporter permease [Phycisphaerales bacterium]